MRTKNYYALPIDAKNIQEERTDSPAHIITKDNDGQVFDESKSTDFFMCNRNRD